MRMEKWQERLEGVWPGQHGGLPIDTSCFSFHRDYKVGHVGTPGTASGESYLNERWAADPLPMCLSLLAAWAVGATGTEAAEISGCDSLVSCQPPVRNREILVLLCSQPCSGSVKKLSRQVESEDSANQRSGLWLTVLRIRCVAHFHSGKSRLWGSCP